MAGVNQDDRRLSYDSYSHTSLSSHEVELYEFSRMCGINMNPKIFKILIELIQMDVDPSAIFTMLQNIAQQTGKSSNSWKNEKIRNSGKSPTSKPPVAAKPKKF